MRFTAFLNFSKHPSHFRSYSYFSKAKLENVNQDINKIAQGIYPINYQKNPRLI